MPGDREAVIAAETIEPGIELASAQLDNLMALGAGQVVVMLISAQPVTELAGAVGEGIDHSMAAQQAESSVDGGEADRDAARSQRLEDLLGGRVVRLCLERLEDVKALAGHADATCGQELLRRT
jgi:hypothetical protein